MNYRYTLQPYGGMSTRYTCPQCNRHKIFSRYIDTDTGSQLSDDVGRCAREDKCGYHYKPADYFKDRGLRLPVNFKKPEATAVLPGPSFLSMELVKRSIGNNHYNCFVSYLAAHFNMTTLSETLHIYRVGTSKFWMGATIFWQIDMEQNVRTGKIMLYDADTGKRVKRPYNHIAWAHKLAGSRHRMGNGSISNYNLSQCFFGEHLLKNNNEPVGVCESEKSAIIAAMCYPKLTWLATGGLAGLTAEKCRCLANRRVIVVPDLNGYGKWLEKVETISQRVPSINFTVMNLLEQHATPEQRSQGLDIADFLKY